MRETPDEGPRLFDLPLEPAVPEPEEPTPPARRGSRRPSESRDKPESLPLFGAEGESEGPGELDEPAPHAARPRPVPAPAPEPPTASLAARARGAFGDLMILGGVGVLAVAGARTLEAAVGVGQIPAILAFLLCWSFLYFVVSLAFWGQTPGMVWAGLVARSSGDEPLSFGQTARRWAATWLTWGLAGAPGLLALSGRSLADRFSGSRTYEIVEHADADELVA